MAKIKIFRPHEILPLSETEVEYYNDWAAKFNEFLKKEFSKQGVTIMPIDGVWWKEAYMQFQESSRYGLKLIEDIRSSGWKLIIKGDGSDSLNPPKTIHVSVANDPVVSQ